MSKKIILVFFCMFLSFSLNAKISKTEKKLTKKEILNRKSAQSTQKYIEQSKINNEKLLDDFVNRLPLEKKVAQLFIENLEGNTNFKSYEKFNTIDKSLTKEPVIAGGYLFFKGNLCDSIQSEKDFISTIYNYAKANNQLPPYLAIDQEGGFVNRLKKLTGGLPSQEQVAQELTVFEAYELYCNQAVKMKELGFNMNLAPVIEVCTDDNKDFLDGRSFGDYEKTVSYGITCVYAYENNNIATVIKHFPGNTNTDPHTGLPEIKLSKEELEESIKSFKEVLAKNPEAILMSHARVSAIDSGMPACLSKIWVTDILRNEYGYNGLIFSDDIFMGALADNGFPPEKAAVMAIEAGINCIMTSEKRIGKQAKVIYKKAAEDEAFRKVVDDSVKRIIKYKIKYNLLSYEDLKDY